MFRSISTTRSCLLVAHSFQTVLQVATLYSDLRITFSAILFSYKPIGIEKIFFSSEKDVQIHEVFFFSTNTDKTRGGRKSKSDRKMLSANKNQLNYFELSKMILCI